MFQKNRFETGFKCVWSWPLQFDQFLISMRLELECADDRSKMSHKLSKNVKIVEFHYHIWNHHEKCIKISTNMPSIGSVIRELTFEITEFCFVKIIWSCDKRFGVSFHV